MLVDVPVGGRRIAVSVRVRRLVCPVLDCPRQIFREQVPGVVERYQRRTNRLTNQLNSVVAFWPARSPARPAHAHAPVGGTAGVPRALGVDDFALSLAFNRGKIIAC
ncbi:hypothetical protein ACIOYT_32645 [Streptomyces halstedii]|uniref:hypothetical protein n=1 Tax=Streptomyces halstedii TaxID=1944 RepID=UPI003805151B